MRRRVPWRSASALLLVVLGCSRSADDGPPPAPEDSFARQCARVADGQADWIAIDSQVIHDRDLNAVRELAGLRELLIEHSRITDAGVASLAGLQQLEHVRIREASIGDEGIRHLARLPKLRILNLPQARFTDRALAELQAGSSLELLRFGSPEVTDQGMDAIRRMPDLRFLHLIDVPLTDQGLEQLHGMPQLESLYLDGTRVTDDGITRFLLAQPHVHLHIDQQHHDRDPARGQHPH